uniref:Uncharacterized protein n=1 Tax=Caenorhabditis japonica TaxID=281687 RepID=A0A8R1DUL6_CAEJA
MQSVLPYVIYFPIYGLDYYCTFTNEVVLFDEYFITLVPAFPCLFDPLISLYSITPYRKKFIHWVKRERDADTHTMVVVAN